VSEAGGTIDRTCEILASLMRGLTVERNALAKTFGMTVASADRYIRCLSTVPGVVTRKQGRRLLLTYSWGDALKEIGR
jgi:hypothetical protein